MAAIDDCVYVDPLRSASEMLPGIPAGSHVGLHSVAGSFECMEAPAMGSEALAGIRIQGEPAPI